MVQEQQKYRIAMKEMNDAINARLMSMQDRRMPISNNSKSRVTTGKRPVSFDTENN